MTISFAHDGTSLTAYPVGRLDTVTSPEFAACLRPELQGVTDLVIDMADVDYLSSGGLRVLLAARQDMSDCGGTIKLIHVNEYIMEIFEMTGFLDMIDVE